MKDKIFIIKNILKIIISILIIISLTKSCSKAYTPEDFHDFLGYCVKHQITSSNSYNMSRVTDIYNNWNTYKGYIENAGYNLSNYNNFMIGINGSSSSPCILAYNGTINYTCTNYNATFSSTSFTQFMFIYNNVRVQNINKTNNSDFAFIFDGSPTNNNFANCVSVNKWSYINILPISDLKTSTLPWYIADVRISEATPNAQIYLYNNGEPVGELQTISHSVPGGTLYQVEIINTNGLINNTNYSVKIYDGTNLLTSSADFTLQWTNDSIPSQSSGDTSGDNSGIDYCTCGPYLIKIIDILSGDIYGQIVENGQIVNGTLDEIRNQLETNNEAIKELTQAMFGSGESGESGEKKNFLEKTYEKMFTLSSGDITEIIESVRNDIQIDSGEIQAENIILEFIKGEPGDFVISWNKYSPTLSVKGQRINTPEDFIPSGEINFSQIERENEALQTTMNWTRTITTWSLIGICIHQGWLILMAMLGVGTAIYGDVKEEKEKLKKQGDNKK